MRLVGGTKLISRQIQCGETVKIDIEKLKLENIEYYLQAECNSNLGNFGLCAFKYNKFSFPGTNNMFVIYPNDTLVPTARRTKASDTDKNNAVEITMKPET